MIDVDVEVIAEVLELYDEVIDSLCALPLSGLSDAGLLALVQGLEARRRRLPAADHRVVAELESRGVAGVAGYASTAALLGLLLRLDPGEAKARVSAAADLAAKVGVSGEPIGPVFAHVAAAQADGVISERHAALIRSAIDDLPLDVRAVHSESAERVLTEQAAVLCPRDLGRVARRLADTLNPDGTLAAEVEQERRRSLRLVEHRDGTVGLEGLLTAACAAMFRPVLDSLSAPGPAQDGTRDPRSASQRAHDGLETMAGMLLRSGQLPQSGGIPVTLLLTITAEQAATGTGYATTAHGALIPTRTALVLADSADVYTVICSASGGVLDYGRTRRLASPAQRQVLAARDRGCSFPGCTAPPSWCDTHHVIPWLLGGLTNVDGMTLLCGFHHRQVDRDEWLCQMSHGRAWWTPPAWFDQQQKPLVNAAHHPPGVSGT